ncbi:MAG: hypothetical protein FJW94_00530 [Actinobacteria bacterium]|nr:hypothetical protein [Actinomycetota bacterium]
MALSEDRRTALRTAALAAVVRSIDGSEIPVDDVAAVGSSAVGVVRDGTAEVFVEQSTPGTIAGAVLWADRCHAEHLRLIVDPPALGALRWASRFTTPTTVFERNGATAVLVDPARLLDPAFPLDSGAPLEFAEPVGSRPLADDADDVGLRDLMSAAGLEVVTEDGVVTGEVLGLEVARLVVWPVDSGGDGRVHLEVGVGRFDRDAAAAVHPGEAAEVSLRRTIDAVAPHRVAGAVAHPAALLARERWLRRSIIDDPSALGVDVSDLEPTPTTVRRSGVRDVAPAAALGRDEAGGEVLVVCSVGSDLGFVPVAADTRAVRHPGARLVLVVPERDLLVGTRRLGELVVGGAELVGVSPPWDPPSGGQLGGTGS